MCIHSQFAHILCTIFAIISAPIIAGYVSSRKEERRNKYNKKLMILENLLAYRKNDEEQSQKELAHVLNLIDVVFAKDEKVLQKYHVLRDVYLVSSDPNFSVNNLYLELLKKIALNLNYQIADIDLDKCVSWKDLQKQAQPYMKNS